MINFGDGPTVAMVAYGEPGTRIKHGGVMVSTGAE
jgi:hypothetical protein